MQKKIYLKSTPMQFGKVNYPEKIDFTLPKDHLDNKRILKSNKANSQFNVYVGCAKWNRQDLKNFYPKGTKDELEYYSNQFNSIELNATFYRIFPPEQVAKWREKTPDNFKFFPKLPRIISHVKRLKETERIVEEYLHSISQFEEKLGMCFLQLNENFAPKDFDRVTDFINKWNKAYPLAIEFRHADWFADETINNEISAFLEERKITHLITDTAGRRDMVHNRLTTNTAFIRFTGANHESDYTRLDDWVERLTKWQEFGLKNLYFFVHQNLELESPLLSAYFIKRMNEKLNINLKIPQTLKQQGELF